MRIPIHLPLTMGTVRVYVTPYKFYGNQKGYDLIKKYGKLPSHTTVKESLISIFKSDTLVRIPSGELPPTITIRGRTYNTKDFFRMLEDTLGLRIISKRENRALKHMQNISLRIPINPDPLGVISKV